MQHCNASYAQWKFASPQDGSLFERKVEPGIGMEAAKWLAAQGIVAFGGDTWASEIYPAKDGQEFPINQFMLAKKSSPGDLRVHDSRYRLA